MTEELQNLNGVRDCVIYQKAEAQSTVSENDISQDLATLGGPKAVAGEAVTLTKDFWTLKAPIVILDDDGFKRYCRLMKGDPLPNWIHWKTA